MRYRLRYLTPIYDVYEQQSSVVYLVLRRTFDKLASIESRAVSFPLLYFEVMYTSERSKPLSRMALPTLSSLK
jgi:hypothetical protein